MNSESQTQYQLAKDRAIQKRIDFDLMERSIPGVVIYAFLWPIIFLSVGLQNEEPFICWGFTIGFAGASLLRMVQVKYSERLYEHSRFTWITIFTCLSLSQAFMWGTLFALSVIKPSMSQVSLVIAFAIGAASSGALSALNPKLWLANSNVCFLLLPGLVTVLFIETSLSMAVLVTIYGAYLLLLGRKSHLEYQRSFVIERQLIKQRLELERLNKIDALTHIYNRGHFNTALEVQWYSGARRGSEQSLLLIDVDHFKSINDSYGHLMGDKCLISIAEIIHKTAKRKTDLIARFGGEEFAILLGDTPLREALRLAETIRENIELTMISVNKKSIKVTVSIGVASMLPREDEDPNLLISKADKALYNAKESGRNRVCSVYS